MRNTSRTAGFSDKASAWKNGVEEAVKLLLSEKNMLFESLIGKLMSYPDSQNLELFELTDTSGGV